jgi:phospholipid/cholesterol/gamma-HCH transport system substrate-binding protein
MSQDASGIEIKVGALVVFSLLLLGAFVVILGDFSFGAGDRYRVEFDNAAGLKPGADVAVSGLQVGQVESLSFLENESAGPGERAVAVRATLRVDKQHSDRITESSEFYISTRSVLGESYVEVVTPSLDTPKLEPGTVVEGNSPPRSDMLITQASKLLEEVVRLIEDPDVSVNELVTNLASLVKHLDQFLLDNREQLAGIVKDGRSATDDAASLLAAAEAAVGDGDAIERMLDDARATASNTRRLSERAGPIVDDLAETSENTRMVSDVASKLLQRNESKLDDSIDNVQASTENLEKLSGNADRLVQKIEDGEGTVGQLLQDRKMYDDMRELLRIVKRQPWKIMWKE